MGSELLRTQDCACLAATRQRWCVSIFMNFVEITSQGGPLILNLDNVTSVQVRDAALVIGIRGSSEATVIQCEEAEQVYAFLREQLRPTSFVVKKPSVGFFSATS